MITNQNIKRMKALLIIASFLVFSVAAQAQVSSLKTLSKNERKAFRKEQAIVRGAEVKALLQDTAFIVQATRFRSASDAISRDYRSSYHGPERGQALVDPNLYFIEVNKDEILIQTGLSHETNKAFTSGLTLRGKIIDLDIKAYKKYSRVKFNFSSSLGYFRCEGRVTHSGLSTFDIESIASSDLMQFRGDLAAHSNSDIYKGGPIL